MSDLRKKYNHEIKPFTDVMVTNLVLNDYKGHWDFEERFEFWREKLKEEYEEVQQVLSKYKDESATFGDMSNTDKHDLLLECADLANICMMIADNTKKLPLPRLHIKKRSHANR